MSSRDTVSAVRRRWSDLSGKERRLLLLMTLVVLAALLWLVAIAPALRVVSTVPAQIARLDLQLQDVQQLAAQAKSMQVRAPIGRAEAQRALDTSVTQRFGALATLQPAADRTMVTLKGVPSDLLVVWLAQIRQGSGATVEQANLRLVGSAWEGTVVVGLPTTP